MVSILSSSSILLPPHKLKVSGSIPRVLSSVYKTFKQNASWVEIKKGHSYKSLYSA